MNVKNNLDWAGWFTTMAERVRRCTSEEQMYLQLKDFKGEFNSKYSKLSRTNRNRKGFDLYD